MIKNLIYKWQLKKQFKILKIKYTTIYNNSNLLFYFIRPQEDSCIDLMINDMLFGKNRQKNTNISKLFVIS